VGLLVISWQSRADTGVSLGYSNLRILDRGFDYISSNNYLDEFNINVYQRIHKSIFATGYYHVTREEASETIATRIYTQGGIIGVRYVFEYLTRFQPYVEAGMAYYWGLLRISDDYTVLRKRDYTIGYNGNIGLLLFLKKRTERSIFFHLFAGYILNSHFDNMTLNFRNFGTLTVEGRRLGFNIGLEF
jgi:hypothetical protein